jgi:hypothetical protein
MSEAVLYTFRSLEPASLGSSCVNIKSLAVPCPVGSADSAFEYRNPRSAQVAQPYLGRRVLGSLVTLSITDA